MNKFKKFLNCSASLTLLAIFFIIDVPSALYAFDRLATETDSQLLIENFRSQKGVWPTGFFSGNYEYFKTTDKFTLSETIRVGDIEKFDFSYIDYLFFKVNFLKANGEVSSLKRFLATPYLLVPEHRKWIYNRSLKIAQSAVAFDFGPQRQNRDFLNNIEYFDDAFFN